VIVCLCKGLNDTTVRKTVREGALSDLDIGRQCGAGTGCGYCRPTLRAILEEEGAVHCIESRADSERPA